MKLKKWTANLLWAAIAVLFISPLAIIVINSLKTFQEILLQPAQLPEKLQWGKYVEVYHTTNLPVVFLDTVVIIVA